MNFNISELNELAQSVSHCLKHFNPKTMFWHTNNAVAFTNHDRFQVQPYRDLKKPFGKLAVLESFARSLGFNTYNGLMRSGIEHFELGENALIALNPNPLNLLVTDCWEEVTRWLMEKLFKSGILTPSILGNFKQSALSQYAVFSDLSSVSLLKWQDHTHFKKNNYKLDEVYRNKLPMIGIADAIFHKGLEVYIESKGMSAWFDSPELDEQAYFDFVERHGTTNKQDVVGVKLADFLVKKEGIDRHYLYLLEEVQSVLSLLYGTKLELNGGIENGRLNYLEIELNLYFTTQQISDYMTARFVQKNYQNYQTACFVLMEKYKDDDALYACVEPLSVYEMQYTAQDLKKKILGGDADYANLGKKVYWVNASVHSFHHGSATRLETGLTGVKAISVTDFVGQIERFLDEQLKPVQIKQIPMLLNSTKAKYEYKYNLNKQGGFTDKFPECMMVMSDYPLKFHLGELFVQTVLLNSIGFDDEYKFIGKPDLLTVGVYWKVMIQQTKSVRTAQESHFFNPIAMLRSLFIYVDDNEGGISFKEDDETVSFNIGLKFIDMLYQFIHTDEYENVHESTNLIFPLCIGINKQTKTCSVLSCGEYSMEYYESIEELDYRNEICPLNEEIAEYLMQFKEVNELISKYCLRFYDGDKKKAYEEAIKYGDFDFEIRPIELVNKGFSLDEIANSEPYEH